MISESQLKRYCCGDVTEIENYSVAIADNTQTWEIHHRKGLKYSKEYLIEKELYFNRPPEELIFLTQSEHMSLHHKGKKLTAETREKMSEAKKDKKRKPFTAEHCANMSKSQKGKRYPSKHFDITVSAADDKKEYMRQYRAKNRALTAK